MQNPEPPDLWRDRERIADRLGSVSGLVLALDFDGTLAPIVERPDDAVLDERIRPNLERLAAASTVAPAVVSGRALGDLRDRVDIAGLDYAGNHGLELEIDGDWTDPAGASGYRDVIDRCCVELTDRLSEYPEVEIENKDLTATVHLRQVADDRRSAVESVVRETVADVDDDIAITGGKAILEIRPPVEWNKGHAVEALANDAPDAWLSIYVGDDVTDEDAFDALASRPGEHLSILVGDRTDTTADYRLDSPADVADFISFVVGTHVDR